MSFVRPIIQDASGLMRNARAGDGHVVGAGISITAVTADANDTLTAAKVAAGAVAYTGFTAGRNITADTAANYLAAFPNMDIGDAVGVHVAITTAFAGTLVTATGVTLKGRATIVANGSSMIYIVKTSATTVDLWVM